MTRKPVTAAIHVAAAPEIVFDYFTQTEAMLTWMGEGAALDPVPGGEFSVDIRGAAVRGRYLEVERPHRLVISWGHAGSDRLPPGASVLEVRFLPNEGGTNVEITHRGLPEPEATGHGRGWQTFLALLANAAERTAEERG